MDFLVPVGKILSSSLSLKTSYADGFITDEAATTGTLSWRTRFRPSLLRRCDVDGGICCCASDFDFSVEILFIKVIFSPSIKNNSFWFDSAMFQWIWSDSTMLLYRNLLCFYVCLNVFSCLSEQYCWRYKFWCWLFFSMSVVFIWRQYAFKCFKVKNETSLLPCYRAQGSSPLSSLSVPKS